MVRGKCCFTFELPDEADIEHIEAEGKNQQAKLIYCIDSDDIRFVYHRNKVDVFVQANFSAKEAEDVLKESCGYAEATMYLYNITGEDSGAAKKFLP